MQGSAGSCSILRSVSGAGNCQTKGRNAGRRFFRSLFCSRWNDTLNQFGGMDLYYLKGDKWFVRRTKTEPQAPDYVADESVEFYVKFIKR